MFSLFRKSPSSGAQKKIKESKIHTEIMTAEQFLTHVTHQIRSAKSNVLMQLSDQKPLYIGHKDLLALTFGKDFGVDPYLELYIPNDCSTRVQKYY